MIKRVKRGVSNQKPERPRAGHVALGMQRPNGSAVGIAMRVQSRIGQYCVLWRAYAELLGPVLLRGKRMPDDVVPIAPAAARPTPSVTREQHMSFAARLLYLDINGVTLPCKRLPSVVDLSC